MFHIINPSCSIDMHPSNLDPSSQSQMMTSQSELSKSISCSPKTEFMDKDTSIDCDGSYISSKLNSTPNMPLTANSFSSSNSTNSITNSTINGLDSLNISSNNLDTGKLSKSQESLTRTFTGGRKRGLKLPSLTIPQKSGEISGMNTSLPQRAGRKLPGLRTNGLNINVKDPKERPTLLKCRAFSAYDVSDGAGAAHRHELFTKAIGSQMKLREEGSGKTYNNDNDLPGDSIFEKNQNLLRGYALMDTDVGSVHSPYRNGPALILPGFYLGSESNAADTNVISSLRIGCIINVAQEVNNPLLEKEDDKFKVVDLNAQSPIIAKTPSSPQKHNNLSFMEGFTAPKEYIEVNIFDKPKKASDGKVRYLKVGWSHDQENLIEYFDPVFKFINSYRECGIPVLINCQQGVNRSASLVIGYVMRSTGMEFPQAYAFVKSRSPGISPSVTFLSQLVEFGDLCKNEKPLFNATAK